jgi:hypothetical protein
VSDKRVQAVLTYAELNELLGQTGRGRIEAIAADPVQRRVKIIFGASGCPDGIEPWVFKIDRPLSPPSAYTSEGSPESTLAAENILSTTARALRCAASWLSNDKDRATVNEVAHSVETAEPTDESLGDVCPVCEEVLCDDDCPLEPVRREFNG